MRSARFPAMLLFHEENYVGALFGCMPRNANAGNRFSSGIPQLQLARRTFLQNRPLGWRSFQNYLGKGVLIASNEGTWGTSGGPKALPTSLALEQRKPEQQRVDLLLICIVANRNLGLRNRNDLLLVVANSV